MNIILSWAINLLSATDNGLEGFSAQNGKAKFVLISPVRETFHFV